MNLDKWLAENEDWCPYVDLVVIPPTQAELSREFPDIDQEILQRCDEAVWHDGGLVSRGAIYWRVRKETRDKGGSSDRWAAMLALQAPPGVQTTDTFWAGRKSWVDIYGESYANTVKRGLAAKGVNLLAGQEYMPELVRPGYGPKNPDPEAVVPFGNARGYIKKLCEKRGWSVNGAVTVAERAPERDPLGPESCKPMGEDLIRQKARKMIQKNPDLKRLPRQAIREIVLAKHGPSK
jgi:hypothetical protein